jgi:hypothetical protein
MQPVEYRPRDDIPPYRQKIETADKKTIEFPYSAKQEKISVEQGTDSTEQGILVRHQNRYNMLRRRRSNGVAIHLRPQRGVPSIRLKENFPDRVFGPCT